MRLVVGLGNPEERYSQTRHNLGFMVLDALLRRSTPVQKTRWRFEKKFNSLIAKADGFVLAKPQTFMNASGFAVASISRYYDILLTDIWVVHDDLDLPLGRIKVRQGGASAGHRGVESIINQLGSNQFTRFRLGIGHPAGKDADGYVLSSFTQKETQEAKRMIKKTTKLLQLALQNGLGKAINQTI